MCNPHIHLCMHIRTSHSVSVMFLTEHTFGPQHLQLLDPSSNSRNYREAYTRTFGSLAVPYVCLFLKDLASAAECNASVIEGGLLNWQRVNLLGGLLLELRAHVARDIPLACSDAAWRFFASLPDPPADA